MKGEDPKKISHPASEKPKQDQPEKTETEYNPRKEDVLRTEDGLFLRRYVRV